MGRIGTKQTIFIFKTVVVDMGELSEEDRRILEDLRDRVGSGESYVRAKQIAERIGLSAKQVGVRLPKLSEKSEDVDIEKWGRSKSTTWRVTRA